MTSTAAGSDSGEGVRVCVLLETGEVVRYGEDWARG